MARTTRKAKVVDLATIPTRKVCRATGFVGTINDPDGNNDFYRDSSQKDGWAVWCKAAEREYNKSYYAGMKKAKVARVREIDNAKARKAYNAVHEANNTRVKRGTFDTTPPARGNKAKVKAQA